MSKIDNSLTQKTFFLFSDCFLSFFFFFLMSHNVTVEILIKLIICVFVSQQSCSLNFQNQYLSNLMHLEIITVFGNILKGAA